ncbi:MAG: hypothetical protein SVM80_13285, partial [Halobacteriota archaeon]|nr:hypothetical protein [Halobacteriota archaeon]
KRVTGISEQELLSHLSVLKDTELLYERGIYPQSSYIFKHALTREVVYDSILTAKKKKLHVKIGDAIEEIHKDDLHDHYEALAGHYITGESWEKGAEYSKLAERKAEKAALLLEAVAHSQKRVACLEKLPRTEDVEKKIIGARTTLGLYCMQMNYHVDAKEAIDPIVDLALERDYKRRVSQIYTILGCYDWAVEEDSPKAFKYLEEALRIAEELDDILSLFMANWWLGGALFVASEFEKALYHFEKALEINVAANSLWGIAIVKSQIALQIHCFQGNIDLAYQMSNEALRIAEASGDTQSKAYAYTALGLSCYYKRSFDEAEGHLLKAADLLERINDFAFSGMAHFLLGETYFGRGEYRRSQEHHERAISVNERGRISPSTTNLYKIALARAKVMSGAKDINLNEIFGYYENNNYKIQEGQMLRHIGEILLNIGDEHMNEAEDRIKRAIEANKSNGTMWELGMAHASYAELLRRKGDLSSAKEHLNTAIGIFKECGADGWVKMYEEELAGM